MTVVDMGLGPKLVVANDSPSAAVGQVSQWTGGAWAQLGGYFDGMVGSVCGADWGAGPSIVAAGFFTTLLTTGQPMHQVAQWDGASWIDLYPPVIWGFAATSLCVYNAGSGPAIYVGGEFATPASIHSNNILRYDGSWHDVGGGLPGFVSGMTVFDDGSGPALYVSTGVHVGGGYSENIVKWDGGAWTTILPAGMPNVFPYLLTTYDDGSGPALILGGQFSSIAGVPANGLAKWDGTGVTALDGLPTGGLQRFVRALATHDDGSGPCLFVSYETIGSLAVGIMRWDGHSWTQVASEGGHFPLASFDDGMGGGPTLWAGGNQFGGNITSHGIARLHTVCATPIDSMCFGDGSYAHCPCSNYGSVGHGCRNSTSTAGALLGATGSPNPDTLTLTSSSEPPTSMSVFLQSDTYRQFLGYTGDGFLCLGGQIRRLYVKTAVNGTVQAPEPGDASISAQSAALGDPLQPGQVRFYQVWYRDSANYCTAATYNASNGIRVVW